MGGGRKGEKPKKTGWGFANSMSEKLSEKNMVNYESNISCDVKEDKLEPLEDW